MFFSLKVASRFLFSNKGQTLLIAFGIAIGVSVQIFIGALIQGLQKDLIQQTVGSSPHITISSDKKINGIENYQEKVDKAKITDGVKFVLPTVDQNAFLKTSEGTYPVLMRGFDLETANNIYKIKDKIIEGSMPVEENQILIGKNLKEEANAKVGDMYQILTPEGIKKDFVIARCI